MPIARPGEDHAMNPSPAVKRSRGEDAVPAPGHERGAVPADVRTIPGWGVDLDAANRPMSQKELPSNVKTVRGNVRHWQKPTMKVHVSNEHPDITPVFGTSCPPHGLSGLLRDYAFEYGEATNRHWMTLILADRVGMVESMITEALHGRADHYIEEKGWSAYRKYGRPPMDSRRTAMVAGAAALTAVALALVLRNTLRTYD